MTKLFARTLLILLTIGIAAGCATPPEKERKLAEKAFADASAAKDCDKENYLAAEELLNRAREAINAGEYDKARELFKNVEEKSQKMMEYYRTHPDECLPKKEESVVDETKEEKVEELPADSPENPEMSFPVIHFEFNKYEIRSEDQQEIERIAAWMKNFDQHVLEIAGHADERGSIDYNMSLGEKRAREVKKQLMLQGIEDARLKIVSYGEEKPVAEGHNEEAWDQNRRAEFRKIN